MSAVRRVAHILQHLQQVANSDAADVQKLNLILYPRYRQLRQTVAEEMYKSPILQKDESTLSLAELRDLTWQRSIEYQGLLSRIQLTGVSSDPDRCLAAVETGAMFIKDLSVGTAHGCNIGLFGLSVLLLGSKKHEKYLPDVENFTDPGCFALTELGHGSNVRGIETTATYNAQKGVFVINSPTPTSQKHFIGLAGINATLAVVFAQLHVNDKFEGVHPFVVRLRNKATKKAMPGVTIKDLGAKMGLNGVDNGAISFHSVEIPRDDLLDRFGGIDETGTYKSQIKVPDARFASQIAALVLQRFMLSLASTNYSKVALATAIKYSLTRRAFHGTFKPTSKTEEVILLDYLSQQKRLFPRLAITYALHFALEEMKPVVLSKQDSKMKHIYAAAAKGYMTWVTRDTLQICREACGGQGFMANNRIGVIRRDFDVYVTFDGDNTLLFQQIAKHLADEVQRGRIPLPEVEPSHTNVELRSLNSLPAMVAALQARESSLLRQLIDSIMTNPQNGTNPLEAWNNSQDVGFSLAQAFCERLIAESFVRAVQKVQSEGRVGQLLANLAEIQMLTYFESDPWFFASQLFKAGELVSIRNRLRQLFDQIRPSANLLVDAFGPALLGVIAGDWEHKLSVEQLE